MSSTDLAIQGATGSVAVLENPTGGRLVAWADAADAAYQLAQKLCATAFVPKHYQGKPMEGAAAILYGDEIGLTPTLALQSIHNINGKPGLYAQTMRALVQAAGHEIETVKKTDSEVVVRGRRRGSETWTTERWTTERARRAGYTSNKKYETDPQAMLLARATSDLCRQIASDALAGLAYSVEEMWLEEEQPTTTVTRGARATSRTARRAVAASTDADGVTPAEPAFEEPDPAITDADVVEITDATKQMKADLAEDAKPGITRAQSQKMHALFGDLNVTERDDRLRYASDAIQREIGSSSELSKAEASIVIESLNADLNAATAAQSLGMPEPTLDGE